MHSRSSANNTVTSGFGGGVSSLREQVLAEVQEPPKENEQDRLLDIENKVQMFKIATDKVNKSMK